MCAVALSRDEVRAIDRRALDEYGVPGVLLMENAGRGAAELLAGLGIQGMVVVCCGRGNNGGDGLVIARHLDNRRIPVRVLLAGPAHELTGDAAINHTIASRSGLPIVGDVGDPARASLLRDQLAAADWVVDALLGTGLAGAVRSPFDRLIAAINDCKARVFAVDIPSGLDCDTGKPLGTAIRARHTATFVAIKKGFAEPAAQEWLGQVHVLGIAAPRRLLEAYGLPPP